MECGSPNRHTNTKANKGSEGSQTSDGRSESGRREDWKVAQKVKEKVFEVYCGAKPKRAMVAVKGGETSSIYRRS